MAGSRTLESACRRASTSVTATGARGRQLSHLRNHPLPYTTISVNKGFAAKLHRDTRNEGPSVALALGEFTGSGLRYWPGDSKRGDVESLRGQPSIVFDMVAMAQTDRASCNPVDWFSPRRFFAVSCADALSPTPPL